MKKTCLAYAGAKAALFCCFMLVLSGCLLSCGGGQKEADGARTGQREAAGPSTGGALVREDSEGLIRVSIVNGKGEMSLDLDKWDSLYHAFKSAGREGHVNGPFRIITQQDCAILDAWVGKIRNINLYNSDLPSLFVVLLMENGTIERTPVWPYRTSGEDDLIAWGPLPWVSGVSAIAGKNNTVYAKNRNNNECDISIPVVVPDIGKRWWETSFQPGDGSYYQGVLFFKSENTVSYEIRGEAYSALHYSGYYEMVLHEGHSGGFPANTIQLFLFNETTEGEPNEVMNALPADIEAAFSVEMDEYGSILTLRRLKGDALFSYNGVAQESYDFESPWGGDPTLYPWELIELVSGNWEFVLPGIECRFDVFYSNFNRFTRDFSLAFTEAGSGSPVFSIDGGLSSGVDDTYGEVYTLTLHFYAIGPEKETFYIKDRGMHRGKRMMTLYPDYSMEKSVFDLLELYSRYGNDQVPLTFAKETSEQRDGRKRINATFNAVFWEYDQDSGTIWLTEAGLGGDEPACVSVEYRVSGIEDWVIFEALPGMDCIIKTDAAGEVVEFILPMG